MSDALVQSNIPAKGRASHHVFDSDLRVIERDLFSRNFVGFVTAQLVARDDDFFECQLEDIVFVAVLLKDGDLLDVAAESHVAEEQRTTAIRAFRDGDVAQRRFAGTYTRSRGTRDRQS